MESGLTHDNVVQYLPARCKPTPIGAHHLDARHPAADACVTL